MKYIPWAIGIAAAVAGAIVFLFSTFDSKESVDMKLKIQEHETVKTLDEAQRALQMEQLQQLEVQEKLVEKELERDTENELMEDKLEAIKKRKENLEEKVYK